MCIFVACKYILNPEKNREKLTINFKKMKKNQLKKLAMALVVIMFGFQAFAQGRIDLNSAKSAQQCTNVTTDGFSATFSFSSIEAADVTTERGVFSNITMDGTYPTGKVGEPTLPSANQLVAVPFGAKDVSVKVKGYTTEVYNLADYGIKQLNPNQHLLRKDQKPEDVPFEYNAEAYAKRGFAERQIAQLEIQGTMRGIQVADLTINPVQYDPVSNTIRVYNNIEVEVSFGSYDKEAAYNEFARTFNPYFANIYKQMFNNRAINDVYDDHPDLWQNPVKMLVIADRMFESTIQDWVAWKTEKGFYVDVNYTDVIGNNANAIKTFIQQKYNEDAPTFLMIMGDKNQVPASATGSETQCVTDLYYMSVDGDEFADMYHSRFPAENVAQMEAMMNKALEYEQLTMPDPSYLSNVLLIAGEDSGWGVTVGRPTIWYATNYYYNTDHGFNQVNEFSHGSYTNCYSYLNSGVGFANYTAHGSNTSWSGPSLTVSDVHNLTNEHKYFLAMGNCCQAADWGISGECFGEAMVRTENKAAYAYIGSCPSTYWLNDYYFGVGATGQANGQMPDISVTTTGCYDAIWDDDAYNVVDAIRFIGNLAGNAAGALGYELHISTLYCWQAYHTLGDGSILPYRVQPTDNNVSHMPTLPIGMDYYTVSAAPGSYVGITKDGVLYGAGMIDETGTTDIPLEPITSGGDVKIVVTHPQHVPYVAVVPAAAMTGPYVAVDTFAPGNVPCGEEQSMSITFKNVGAAATSGTTNVVITCDNDALSIIDGEGSFGALEPDATITLNNEFSFIVTPGVPDNTKIQIDVTCTNGSDSWVGKAVVTVGAPIIEYTDMQWAGSFVPGETYSIVANFHNKGHYMATNAEVTIASSSSYVTFAESSVAVGTIAVNGDATAVFNVTVSASCPATEVIELVFNLQADNEVVATGVGQMKNSCNVVFDLVDSWGDGWNGNKLVVAFSDGSPTQELTISSGNSETYILEITTGVHVTLSWISGSYTYECSFTVSYEDGDMITEASDLSASYSFAFDVNCSGEPITVNPIQNLAAAVDGNNVTLTWEAPVSGTPLGYIIKRDGIEIDEVNELSYFDEGLDWETTYTYNVIAKYAAGNSIPVAVTVETGNDAVEENSVVFGVYPNPADNVLNISSNANSYEYQIINSVGQVVMSGKANGNETINVSELSGVYFLRIIADGDVIVRKVTVK